MSKTERGTVSVEAALLIPVLVLVAAVAMAGWRVWWAGAQVQAAAEAAARAASVAGSAGQAHQAVGAVVEADLRTAGLHCADLTVQEDLAAAAGPAGTPGTVRVSITCTVTLDDLLVPGLPGSIIVRGDASETVDVFRRRER